MIQKALQMNSLTKNRLLSVLHFQPFFCWCFSTNAETVLGLLNMGAKLEDKEWRLLKSPTDINRIQNISLSIINDLV